MWIFLNDAFLSVVAHTEKPDHLHVRARVAGDLERTFAAAVVTETPHGDYRYRIDVPRTEMAAVLTERMTSIDYPNFKGSVGPDDHARRRAYMDVWSAMVRLQGDRARS